MNLRTARHTALRICWSAVALVSCRGSDAQDVAVQGEAYAKLTDIISPPWNEEKAQMTEDEINTVCLTFGHLCFDEMEMGATGCLTQGTRTIELIEAGDGDSLSVTLENCTSNELVFDGQFSMSVGPTQELFFQGNFSVAGNLTLKCEIDARFNPRIKKWEGVMCGRHPSQFWPETAQKCHNERCE